jgi:hypothetical protein
MVIISGALMVKTMWVTPGGIAARAALGLNASLKSRRALVPNEFFSILRLTD